MNLCAIVSIKPFGMRYCYSNMLPEFTKSPTWICLRLNAEHCDWELCYSIHAARIILQHKQLRSTLITHNMWIHIVLVFVLLNRKKNCSVFLFSSRCKIDFFPLFAYTISCIIMWDKRKMINEAIFYWKIIYSLW